MARKAKKMAKRAGKGMKAAGLPSNTDKAPGGKKAPGPKNKPMPMKPVGKTSKKKPKLEDVTF